MLSWNFQTAIRLTIALSLNFLSSTVLLANTSIASNPQIELITLGVAGGPLPRKNSTQLSDLLIINGQDYLIDAGDNVTRRIVQADHDFKKISPIFITHPHSDHTLGLATLLISQWEYQKRTPTEIYGPAGLNQIARGVLEYAKANEEIRWAEGKKNSLKNLIDVHEVGDGLIYQDQNVKVYAVENSHFHFQPNTKPYGKYKSYSYKFVSPSKTLFFTGDTGPSEPMEKLLQGSDVMISEVISIEDTIDAFKKSGIWQQKTQAEQQGMIQHFQAEHITPAQIGIMASKAGVKTVILTHFTPTANDTDDFARYATAVKQHFNGEVLISKDLQKFKF